MEQPQTSLQKKEAQELVPLTGEVPAFVNRSGRGLEDVRKEDLVLPRVKLLQPLSPEVIDGKGKPGEMVNSLTGENYGTEITFIPLKQSYSRIYWGSKDPGSDILCSSRDGKKPDERVENPVSSNCATCPKSKWNGDVAPECTEFYNFPALLNGNTPVALSFNRTKIPVAKKLISQASYAGKGADLFALKFKLRSVSKKGQKGTFFNFEVAGAGWVKDEAEYKAAEAFYTAMKEKNVTVHTENEGEQV